MQILFLLFSMSLGFTKTISFQEISEVERLTKLKGEKLFSSEVQVVYFLSANCPCSQSHFDYLNNIAKKYPKFEFFGFHSSKYVAKKRAKEYFDQYKIDFPIYFDGKLKYANLFGALKTPHVFVINKMGDVLYHGGVSNSKNIKRAKKFYLDDALGEIAMGKSPTRSYAKALGCYIKR